VKFPQILRISVALALIFASGILTGRLTAPRSPTALAGAGRRTITSDDVLAHLTAELGLNAGQKAKAQVIVEEAAEQMATLPVASPQRRDVFRKLVPQIREILRPDQYTVFDRYVEMAERRWSRMIRRREAKQGAAQEELPPPKP
jgi:hypothetical protein